MFKFTFTTYIFSSNFSFSRLRKKYGEKKFLFYIFDDMSKSTIPKVKRNTFLSLVFLKLLTIPHTIYKKQIILSSELISPSHFLCECLIKCKLISQLSLLLAPIWTFYVPQFLSKMAVTDRYIKELSYNDSVFTFYVQNLKNDKNLCLLELDFFL